MRGYSKADVEMHGGHPAVNVKVYRFPDTDDVIDRFRCSEATAERALEIAWESATDTFWNFSGAGDIVDHYFPGAEWYSAGRSGGWLIVTTIGHPDDWDGVQLNRWACFERAVRQEVEYRTSKDAILEDIECNRWAEDVPALEADIGDALEGASV